MKQQNSDWSFWRVILSWLGAAIAASYLIAYVDTREEWWAETTSTWLSVLCVLCSLAAALVLIGWIRHVCKEAEKEEAQAKIKGEEP